MQIQTQLGQLNDSEMRPCLENIRAKKSQVWELSGRASACHAQGPGHLQFKKESTCENSLDKFECSKKVWDFRRGEN